MAARVDSQATPLLKTKIICTIGPASRPPDVLQKMLAAGMHVARLNLAHGDKASIASDIAALRQLADTSGAPLAIMADLAGPKIRTGDIGQGQVTLTEGQRLALTTEPVVGTAQKVSITYPQLVRDVRPGDIILLADGTIQLEVAETSETEIGCRVAAGGVLRSRQGINLPQVTISAPAITPKDREDLSFCLEQGVDWIALSFVRRPEDIEELKTLIRASGRDTPVVAKIEKREAVGQLDTIIAAADGVMVARGDLGVELPTEDVPIVQKEIIGKAQRAGKPVIIATQMLDSMIREPRPTRAEASDVANAIFDGVDAVMLSGETAIGHFPVDSVATMARIAARAEETLDYQALLAGRRQWAEATVTDAISYATCQLALIIGARAIISTTESGKTARQVSRYRPRAAIVAVSPNAHTVRQLMLSWGVVPVQTSRSRDINHMLDLAVAAARQARLIASGDQVVITAGALVNVPGTTNLIKVEKIE